jgi:hypothetical protein
MSLLPTPRKRLAHINPKYRFTTDFSQFRIFIRKQRPHGETVFPLKIERHTLLLIYRATNERIEFKYTHTPSHGWGWTDSRMKGRQPQYHVVSEIARMLFNGNQDSARLVVDRVLNNAA